MLQLSQGSGGQSAAALASCPSMQKDMVDYFRIKEDNRRLAKAMESSEGPSATQKLEMIQVIRFPHEQNTILKSKKGYPFIPFALPRLETDVRRGVHRGTNVAKSKLLEGLSKIDVSRLYPPNQYTAMEVRSHCSKMGLARQCKTDAIENIKRHMIAAGLMEKAPSK